jgi:cytoskeletal protein RodZ
MTENNDIQPSKPPVPGDAGRQNERVGEILRREREQRRISIEDVAKKLRLNAKYIEAIESNQYDKLPGDTYIRVYLRSLSSFLSLNAGEIFRRFFEERGVTGVDTLRKDSSTKINIAAQEEKKPNTALIVTLAVIALLVIFSVIVNRQGCHSSHAGKHAKTSVDTAGQGAGMAVVKDTGTQGRSAADTATADSQTNESKPVRKEEKSGAETVPAKQLGNIVKPAQPPVKQVKDTVKKSAVSPKPPAKKGADTVQKAAKYQAQLTKDTVKQVNAPVKLLTEAQHKVDGISDTAVKGRTLTAAVQTGVNPMVLRMTVTGDSCWGRVFSDGGKEWKNTVSSGKGVTFTAQDSFNVHIGVGGAVSFTLNGKPVRLPDKKGVMTFKIDRSGAVTLWPLEKWNSVFGGHF